MSKPRTIIEKVWDAHVVHEQHGAPTLLYIDLHLVHEVTSPQAFQGLRDRGLQRAPAGPHPGHRRPQHPHHRPQPAYRGRDCGQAARATGGQLQRVRYSLPGDSQRAAGHCARDRAGTRPHAAGHDGGLRRQPYGDARSFRRAGLRHRYQRSGARACHAVLVAAALQELPGEGGRHTRRGRHRQGHHPGADREDRCRRRHGVRVRVHRQRHPRAFHGRAHDGVQHGD